jgi:hypothetical protein
MEIKNVIVKNVNVFVEIDKVLNYLNKRKEMQLSNSNP